MKRFRNLSVNKRKKHLDTAVPEIDNVEPQSKDDNVPINQKAKFKFKFGKTLFRTKSAKKSSSSNESERNSTIAENKNGPSSSLTDVQSNKDSPIQVNNSNFLNDSTQERSCQTDELSNGQAGNVQNITPKQHINGHAGGDQLHSSNYTCNNFTSQGTSENSPNENLYQLPSNDTHTNHSGKPSQLQEEDTVVPDSTDVYQTPESLDHGIMGATAAPVSPDVNHTFHTLTSLHVPPTMRKNTLTNEFKKLAQQGWYWGPLTRSEAEDKLNETPNGSFLVRDSSDERYLLSLSFRSFGRTLHTRIEHSSGNFSFYENNRMQSYDSVVDLIMDSVRDSQEAGIFCYSRTRDPLATTYPVRLIHPVSRLSQVRTLQYLCRFVIRQYTRIDHIESLPLPNPVKGYLNESYF
uniref:Suppressor of cytokine signaling 6 n=1 Tax=Ciona intestinalis TaxID=7719 RepID=Q4H2S5_CIOIN|nr:suppressor of cytokine signaling [Ciona intestinalis]BAE06702.1 suppressor of cytokine signaling [Ciona intestinalis]|eukprot:NP_001072006.1 suppressor of cytokine signaling [Ciona intestinalis]